MSQTFDSINTGAGGDTVRTGIINLVARTLTLLSNSSGVAFPTTELEPGRMVYRTDQEIVHILKTATPSATWVKLLDLNDPYITQATADAAYQPIDAILTSLSAVTSAADKLPYFSGVETISLADFTAHGRALAASASATATRTLLALGDAATKNVGVLGGVQGYDANTVKSNVSTAFTAAQVASLQAQTFSTSFTWAVAANQQASITLTGNISFQPPTGGVNGGQYGIYIKMGGAGGYTLDFSASGIDFGTAGSPQIGTNVGDAVKVIIEKVSGGWIGYWAGGFAT